MRASRSGSEEYSFAIRELGRICPINDLLQDGVMAFFLAPVRPCCNQNIHSSLIATVKGWSFRRLALTRNLWDAGHRKTSVFDR